LDLLDQHGASLHRLLARLTRCEHATGDLMQELFLRLAGSRGFDQAHHPYAFAWRTAANLAFEWRRRRGRLADREDARQPNESPATPLEELIRAERLERVLQATSRLNELGRNVVVMRFIEQEPYDEIARRLGKNPNYIRVLCSKSVRKLRGILDRQDPAHAGTEVSHD
jgi:RNA polymerase sigma factor (sigma-70 family)